MILKKIKVKNIRSFLDEELEFPRGSTLVSGEIGSGKTSLLLAIEYALFGLQPGQKGSSLLRNTSDEGSVSLEFEVSGINALVERRLKRTQKGVTNDYAAITIGGEKSEASVTEIKSKILSLLGYPPEFVKRNNILYRYTVYSPQEQMKQIILEDPESRLNILRNIFGVDRYRKIKENLIIILGSIKNNSKILQGEINSLEEEKEGLEVRKINLKKTEEKIRDANRELKEKTRVKSSIQEESLSLLEKLKEKNLFEREIEKTKVLITTKRELISSLGTELEESTKSIEEVGKPFNQEDYSSVLLKIKDRNLFLGKLNSSYIEIMGKSNSLQKERESILKKKERIFRIDICPTCLQDVSETHKHNILNETETTVSQIEKELVELVGKKAESCSEIEQLKKEISLLEEERTKLEILKSKTPQTEKLKLKLVSLGKQKSQAEQDYSMLDKHLDRLKEKVLRYKSFEYQFKKKEEELKLASQKEKESEIILAELKKESELSLYEISLSEKRILSKELSRAKLKSLGELSDWLSGEFLNLIETIERNVLLRLRSTFSSIFRKWFLLLVPENSLESEIDENFTPLIMQGGNEMDYSFLSGGERTAVALAYRLALNQTINNFMGKLKTQGIVILDEPTEGFSETQIEKIRDILLELNSKQLIIVSHEQKVEGFVDNIFKISKSGNVSTIEKHNPNYQKA